MEKWLDPGPGKEIHKMKSEPPLVQVSAEKLNRSRYSAGCEESWPASEQLGLTPASIPDSTLLLMQTAGGSGDGSRDQVPATHWETQTEFPAPRFSPDPAAATAGI